VNIDTTDGVTVICTLCPSRARVVALDTNGREQLPYCFTHVPLRIDKRPFRPLKKKDSVIKEKTS